MLIELYKQLLFLSVITGGLYLIFKLISPLTHRYYSSGWHYYTCLIICSFFVIPYFKTISLFYEKTVQTPSLKTNDLNTILEPVSNEISILQKMDYARGFFNFAVYIFMAGALVFIIISLIKAYKVKLSIFRICLITRDNQILTVLYECKQELGIKQEIPIYKSTYISSPFIYGSYKPCIVLPDIQLTSEELRYIFLHELHHWKRGDGYIKNLIFFINAIHWFNPLAYLARYDILRFCELSCDEAVVKAMNNQERREYCELILSVLWKVTDYKSKFISAFSNERKHLERRISMIMKKESGKRNKIMKTVSITMTVLLVITGSVMAYASYPFNKDAIEENVAIEGIGGIDFLEDKDNIFLDSYYTGTEDYDIEINNIVIEGISASLLNQDNEDKLIGYTNESEVTIEGDIGILAQYTIDWNVAGGKSMHGSSQLNMSKGAKVPYNISWTPRPGVIRVGLYNNNTGSYYWADSGTTPALKGTITVPSTGLYSFAIGNTTDTTVNATGSFSY